MRDKLLALALVAGGWITVGVPLAVFDFYVHGEWPW